LPVFKAIILGLVQGLTEFLPVSSSGHLVVVPYLLSWEQPSLAVEVALHFGTLVAVMAYFSKDLWWLGTRTLGIGVTLEGEREKARRTMMLLAIGSVPAALFGFAIEPQIESTFSRDPRWAGGFLLVTAALLFFAERLRRNRAAASLGVEPHRDLVTDVGRDESTVTHRDAVVIGVAQALAIFPGISRAGATMAAGMTLGLSRGGAARFSFMLSIPVVLGASIFKFQDMVSTDAASIFTGQELIVAVLTSAVTGFWAIRFLLRLVSRDDLTGFARYAAMLGVLTLAGYAWLGPPSSI
jgi:undecaprenyl-diphosphatase